MSENQKTKIPNYMKCWFWIIVAFILFIIVVNIKSNNPKSNTTNNTYNSSSTNTYNKNNSTSINTTPTNTNIEDMSQLDTLVLSYGNSAMNSYVVGKDFAEGKYKITVNNSTCSGNFIVYKDDIDYETICHERLGVDGITEIPEIELKNGNLIEIYKDLIIKIELIK